MTPNVDTVYSQAWLDISTEPMVYVLPETDRFCNVQLLDAWTNTAAVLDKAGAYAIALPGWEGELPDGVTRVDVPTATMWSITRTVLSGNEDCPMSMLFRSRCSSCRFRLMYREASMPHRRELIKRKMTLFP